MTTPTFVKFSTARGTIGDALARLDQRVLPSSGLEYHDFAALRPDDDPYTGGLDLAQDLVPCHSRLEALTLAQGWTAWAISYLARQVPGDVNLYFFNIDLDSFGAAVSFDSSLLTFETDELERGEWLRQLFITMTAALGCDVCGYGPDTAYSIRYESLNPAVLVDRLRAGDLFTMRRPNFHAISVALIRPEEMTALLRRLPRSDFLDYRLSTTGYHILSVLP
jgi:hypothetical protein